MFRELVPSAAICLLNRTTALPPPCNGPAHTCAHALAVMIQSAGMGRDTFTVSLCCLADVHAGRVYGIDV